MKRFNITTTISVLPALLLVLAAGCGGGGGAEGGEEPAVVVSEGDSTGIDVSKYAASSTVGSFGGQIVAPDGTTIEIPPYAIGTDVGIGIGETSAPSNLTTPAAAVSGWYEAGTTRADIATNPDAPFYLAIPIQPTYDQIDHPGLQVWVHVSDDVQFPLHGRYESISGMFIAQILSLPAKFRFAVVFNPDMVRLDADDQVVAALQVERGMKPRAGKWATTDWVIDYDGKVLTALQASKVLDAARRASLTYSNAGFADPILQKTSESGKDRWHIHLINGGSHFSGNSAATDQGIVQLSGNLYVNTACIDNEIGPNANSVYAQVAHELFHAVFWGYRVPYANYTYQEGGTTYGYRSSSGFNEGMATAIGTYIEQSQAIPRPSTPAFNFEFPLGYFSPSARSMAYRNQDFFVFLLRVGTLSNIRQMLESLATAQPPPGTNLDDVAVYGAAIEAGGIGVADAYGSMSFNDFLSEYMANRGFVRSWEGWIWPTEPSGGTPGQGYRLDRKLFGDNRLEIDERDCEIDRLKATCQVEFPDALAMTGMLVDMDLGYLADAFDFNPTVVSASASVATGKVSYWLLGESAGAGHSGFMGRAANGSSVSLIGFKDQLTDLRMIVTNGSGSGPVLVTVEFAGEPDENMGPECRELADCCPNLPTQAVIEQCNDIVAGHDENNCAIGQISLLRLCRDEY